MEKAKDRRPLIIAHRGDSSHAPENTLAAFRMALDKGSDGVEFDVQLSKDGVPVVIHDSTLKRTGGRKENVADLTAEELGKADAGSWFNKKYPKLSNPAFAAESVPTLAQVLKLLESSEGLIYIELKCGETGYEQLAKAVCDVIRDSPQLSQMIVKSFKLATIPIVRCYLPEVQTAPLFEPNILNFLQKRKHILALANELGAAQISIHTSLATRKLAALATQAHLPVTIWTADKVKWVKKCGDFGIKALITNDPAKMVSARTRS